jgi:hypothetical protein
MECVSLWLNCMPSVEILGVDLTESILGIPPWGLVGCFY